MSTCRESNLDLPGSSLSLCRLTYPDFIQFKHHIQFRYYMCPLLPGKSPFSIQIIIIIIPYFSVDNARVIYTKKF
jgi:hypothetical protein